MDLWSCNGLLVLALALGVCMASSLGTAAGDVFYVGDEDGWVGRPAESYEHWAGRSHFHVKDTLVFRYKKNADSVLVVDRRHYEACDGSDPIEELSDGDSAYVLGRAGPFYFISGDTGRCEKGQKLMVVVIDDPPLSLQLPSSAPLLPPSMEIYSHSLPLSPRMATSSQTLPPSGLLHNPAAAFSPEFAHSPSHVSSK